MPEWRVQLVGDRFDLEELPKLFSAGDFSIEEDTGEYYLRATQFGQLSEASAVRAKAQELLPIINGAARLVFRNMRPAKLGHVQNLDPRDGETHVFLEGSIEARSKASAVLVVVDDQPQPGPPPPPTYAWAQQAQVDPLIHRVLGLLAADPITWYALYKIHELIEESGDAAAREGAGISKKELRRFTQTANSFGALGEHARHAHEKFAPPKNPMTLAEATALISSLVRAWMERRRKAS